MFLIILVLAIIIGVVYSVMTFRRNQQTITDISGRYVFITGCDTGFGHLLAIRLDDMGLHVIAGCLTEHGRKELEGKTTSRSAAIIMDVSKRQSIKDAVKFTKEFLPPSKGLWGLVNNAGIIGGVGPAEWIPKENYLRTFDVNLFGVTETTRHFLPLVRKARGRIVNMSSVVGSVDTPMLLPYALAKRGVEIFSSVLRSEATKYGVSVHIVKPSTFNTNISLLKPFTACMTSCYNQLEDDVKSFYGEEFKTSVLKWFQSALVPSDENNLVIEAYTHALTSLYPNYRYRVGPRANTLWRILEHLPRNALDMYYKDALPTPVGCK